LTLESRDAPLPASAWLADAPGPVSGWVANVDANAHVVHAGGLRVPVLVDGPAAFSNSYVAGARSAWLDYALDELIDGRRPARFAALPLRATLGGMLRAAGFHRCAWFDNPLFSTQLPAPGLAGAVPALEAWAAASAPGRLRLWRNVCGAVDGGLSETLVRQGWQMLPARQVYLCDPDDSSLWKRNHVRRDQKLMKDPEVSWVTHEALRESDLPALRRCFRAVFIDKHSAWNPDFTAAFFERQRLHGPLEFVALRWNGALVGVLGLYAQAGWLTTPLIGYDTTAPASLGLYRRLMARLLFEARERGLRLHYSSGAGEFKRNRGGEPVLEYTAADARGLAPGQRHAFAVVARGLRSAAPAILQRFG
jgi:hypothetical protein